MERTLYRSRHDRMIAGVAGGIAEYFAIDPTLVRLALVVLAVIGNLAVVVAYIVMAIVVPEEPEGEHSGAFRPAAPAPGAPPSEGAAAYPSAQPPAEEVLMAEDDMGPGDMPEPGEFGSPPMPDPSEGVPPGRPVPSEERRGPTAQETRPMPAAAEPRRGTERRGGTVAGLVLIALGAVFLLERFTGIGFADLWPLILIAIGIAIMFTRGR